MPLTGLVTEDNIPQIGVKVQLIYCDGGYSSIYATSTTDGSGNSQFTNLPPLGENQVLYVSWQNSGGNPNRLWSWLCNIVSYPTTNPEDYVCDFDLDNMDMLLPISAATASLPYTFTWDKRVVTSDNYHLNLSDKSEFVPFWQSSPLGYVDTFTLNNLPNVFVPWEPYGW